jgi:hypothetical protein
VVRGDVCVRGGRGGGIGGDRGGGAVGSGTRDEFSTCDGPRVY